MIEYSFDQSASTSQGLKGTRTARYGKQVCQLQKKPDCIRICEIRSNHCRKGLTEKKGGKPKQHTHTQKKNTFDTFVSES